MYIYVFIICLYTVIVIQHLAQIQTNNLLHTIIYISKSTVPLYFQHNVFMSTLYSASLYLSSDIRAYSSDHKLDFLSSDHTWYRGNALWFNETHSNITAEK